MPKTKFNWQVKPNIAEVVTLAARPAEDRLQSGSAHIQSHRHHHTSTA